MDKKRIILVFFVYLILILLVFGGLTKTFFQQDEWATFGNMIYAQEMESGWLERLLPLAGFSHFAPFPRIIPKIMFDFFGINFLPYALLPLILQVLNSFLVFYLALILTKKKWLSFLAGLFFAINSISRQTIIWIAASTGAQGSALFLLLSLIFLAKRKPWLSTLAFLFSLFFKETSIFLFAFLPIFLFIFSSEKKLSKIKIFKFLLPLWLMAFLYFGLRFLLFFNAPPPPGTPYEVSQPTAKEVYVFRFFTHPLKSLSQSFIPQEEVVTLSRLTIRLAYPWFVASNGAVDPYVAETVGADIFSYGGAVLVLAGLVFLVKRLPQSLKPVLAFSLILMLLASWPLLFISGRAGYFSLIEGRHLYLLGIGSSLIWAILLRKRNVLTLAVLLLLVGFSVFRIQKDIQKQIELGDLRRSILEQIYHRYPKLPEKVIFYIESDLAYYGLPPEEKILPFQSGLGQTLMVWYYGHGQKLPPCFFPPEEDFLYAITEQDYRECQGRGFGYFRQPDKLKEAIKKNKLAKENIISFSFNSQNNSLEEK